ncbi:MAG TPA: amidohydrolase [Patescibacteria group bacterium]|nr:amidohydrolase [Patescibacteria group bacterium]
MLNRAMVPVRVTVVMLASLGLLLAPGTASARPNPADTVIVNGAILVFHGIEVRSGRGWPAGGAADFGSRGASEETRAGNAEPEFAEALAIEAGKIVFIGSSKKAHAYVGPSTKVVSLGGRMVMPGIVDGHFHGTRPTDCAMGYEGGTVAKILARLQTCLDSPEQAAFKGTNTRFEANNLFGESIEPAGTPLTRQDLDRLETTRPIWVENADGHKFWMNGKAIANAGISRETPDPPAGVIGREADRTPNGFFADIEVDHWGDERPVTDAMRLDWVARTEADANRAGLTSIFIPGGGEEEIAQWAALQDQGKMTVRAGVGLSASFVRGNSDAQDLKRRIDALAAYKKYAKGLITVDAVKVYCDGVMEYPAQTAAMLAPYRVNAGTAARPEWRPGTSRGPDPSCADARPGFVALDRAGWQIHVHAIGDRAVRDALDNFQAALEANGARDLRHTITHLQTIDPADVPRFGKLGVVASMSLHWARRDGYSVTYTQGYIGDDLYDHQYPAYDLWRTGGVVAGGSDYPVDPLQPFTQIETAITRTGEPLPGVFPGALAPREAIPDLLAVIRMHTINSAYEMHQEKVTGSIEVGKQADLIVLDQNLFRVPAARISDTRVLLTMLGGKIVYDSGERGAPK